MNNDLIEETHQARLRVSASDGDLLRRLADALEAEHKKNAILTVAGEPHRRSRRRWESLERNVESAQAKIDKVRELHQPWEESGKCRECSSSLFSIHSVRWPCATIRALGDEND